MREALRRLERAHADRASVSSNFFDEEKGEDWKVLEENKVVVTTTTTGDGDEKTAMIIDAFMTISLRDLSAIRAFSGTNYPPLVCVKIINCPNVKRIPSGCFERCEKTLRELWVCECGLETLDGLKGFEFESLEVLVLYGNEIEEVESTFMCCRSDDEEEEEDGGKKEARKKPPFQNLKRLMLNENKIREIGKSFTHMKSLECVDLSENLITGEALFLEKSGNATDVEMEWLRSVAVLNLAANPMSNDAVVHVIAKYAKNIVDIRFRDDISGASPIACGICDTNTLESSDAAYSRYASKCVAAFGESLRFLDGYELTPSLRERLLEQHDNRRALYYAPSDERVSDLFREAAITPLFLDERAIIIHSEAEEFAHDETEKKNAEIRVVIEEDMALISMLEGMTFRDVTFLDLPSRVHSKTLVSLKIQNCSLASLEGLQSCTNLHSLDASSNRISKLDSAWFIGLNRLIYLDLSDNEITNIDRDAMLCVHDKCPNLRHLRLARNQIRTLLEVQNLLERNTDETSSKTQINNKSTCYADVLRVFILKYIDLRGNAVTNLENYRECAAYFAPSLVLLDGEEVREIWRRKGRFLFQGRLTTEMIEQKLAENMNNNDDDDDNFTLNLSEMRVRRLDEESVSGVAMASAKILNFEKNQLSDVSALGCLKHLRRLSMPKNALRFALVREPFVNGNTGDDSSVDERNEESSRCFYEQFFPQLKELDVRYNRIDSRRLVRLQLQKLQLLSFVDVSNNRLQNLDGLKNLRNLRKIRADENPLRQFNENTFLGFGALESLSMKRCGVRSFAHLNALPHVNSLRLDGNRVKDKALALKQLAGVNGLKKLSLRGCKFASSYFDEAVFALETLEFLDGIKITCEDRERIRTEMEERRAREEALKFQETTLKRMQVVVQQVGLVHILRTPSRTLISAMR